MRLGWLFTIVAALLLAIVPAVPCLGADAHEPAGEKDVKAADTAGYGDHAKGGDDLFGQALDLAIWTVVVFLVLLFVLSKFAWKPMLAGLQQREESIRGAVEEAKQARAETERARAEFKQELAKAHEEIPKLLDEARKDAQRLAEEMRAKAVKEIAEDRQRLRKEIETARDQALQELWTNAAQLATLISAKTVRRSLSPDDHRRLVDEALVELKNAGTERQRQVASV